MYSKRFAALCLSTEPSGHFQLTGDVRAHFATNLPNGPCPRPPWELAQHKRATRMRSAAVPLNLARQRGTIKLQPGVRKTKPSSQLHVCNTQPQLSTAHAAERSEARPRTSHPESGALAELDQRDAASWRTSRPAATAWLYPPRCSTTCTPLLRSSAFFHCTASRLMCTVACMPTAAAAMPTLRPKLPVDPTCSELLRRFQLAKYEHVSRS